MNKSPVERVREHLAQARDLAREILGTPSEDAVLTVFRRLCDEADMMGPVDMPAPMRGSKPSDRDEDLPEHAGHTKH